MTRTTWHYGSADPRHDQDLARLWGQLDRRKRGPFLVDDLFTHSIYCYSHKAASSTWMSVYVKLNPDPNIEDKIENKTYR